MYKLCNKMQCIFSVSVLLGCDTLSLGPWRFGSKCFKIL